MNSELRKLLGKTCRVVNSHSNTDYKGKFIGVTSYGDMGTGFFVNETPPILFLIMKDDGKICEVSPGLITFDLLNNRQTANNLREV